MAFFLVTYIDRKKNIVISSDRHDSLHDLHMWYVKYNRPIIRCVQITEEEWLEITDIEKYQPIHGVDN